MAAPPAGVGGRRGLTVGLILCVVATAFEYMAVLTAMPAAAADLGGEEFYAWAFTGFMIAQTFAIVAAGQAADRLGPVRPLAVGLTLFALGLVAAGLAPTMPLLVLARFVQGLGAGAINTAVFILVAQAYDARARAVMVTAFSFAWMAPTFLGPSIAAWLTHTWSWHWVFWSVLPLVALAAGLIAGPLLRLHLPAPAPGVPGLGGLLLRAALVAAGAALLQWAGQHLEPLSLVWLAAGLGLLVWALPPLMPAHFAPFRRGLSAVVTVRALTSGAFYGTEAFIPLMLVTAFALPLQQAALLVMLGSVGWTVGGWLQSRPWLRLRRDTIVTVGAAITATGLLAIAASVVLAGRPLGVMATGWVVAGLGMGLAHSSTSLALMQLADEASIGHATASLQVGEALGNAVVGGIAGTLYVVGSGSPDLVFALVIGVMVAICAAGVAASVRIGALQNHSIILPTTASTG